MQIKIEKEFIDKYTQELHKVGEVLDVTEERFQEITKTDSSVITKVMEKKKKGEENGIKTA